MTIQHTTIKKILKILIKQHCYWKRLLFYIDSYLELQSCLTNQVVHNL